jgi:hypothetical protein
LKPCNKNIKNLFKLFITVDFIRDTPKTYLSGQGNFNENRSNIKSTSSLVIFVVFQLYILTGCSPFRKGNELTKFESFQFSFQDPSNSKYFSVLFSQSDTVFLKKYSHSDNDTVLYSILPDSARSIINKFVIDINSSVMHPVKVDSLEDSNPSKVKFYFYIDYSDGSQQANFHSLHPPAALEKFYSWVNQFIDNSKFYYINRAINFK